MQNTGYRIVYEAYQLDDKDIITDRSILHDDKISKPTSRLDISISHMQQIKILQSIIDKVINEKAKLINSGYSECPHCTCELNKHGQKQSTIHDVFTDHLVNIQRLRCPSCQYEAPSTIRRLFNGVLTAGLAKIQAELGAENTFRESEAILEKFSAASRKINNHCRIKEVAHSVGMTIPDVDKEEASLLESSAADDLVVCVDGGHVKAKGEQRSFEAMTAVVYRPESLKTNPKGTRNHLSSKSCAASVRDDEQEEMKSSTIIAAIKEGMTASTKITALCDGATNCWNIIESLRPLCAGMTCILDWFHLAMKIQNISLPDKLKTRLTRTKWHLWRGNTELALIRLEQILVDAKSKKEKDKIIKLVKYIKNNEHRIVNYRKRKKNGLVFTSNLAESTVESLINDRCKGQQHMRWTRQGLNPILQLRAKIKTKDWDQKWETVILNSSPNPRQYTSLW